MKKLMTIMLALAMTAGVAAQQKTQKSDAQVAINNIMTRTSIRQYTNEAVSKADIETMLRAGMAAPQLRSHRHRPIPPVRPCTARRESSMLSVSCCCGYLSF